MGGDVELIVDGVGEEFRRAWARSWGRAITTLNLPRRGRHLVALAASRAGSSAGGLRV